MLRYSVFRLLRALITFWGVLTIVFVIPRLLGDPIQFLVGDQADQETIEAIRRSFGLDRPIIVQYFDYLLGVLPARLRGLHPLQDGRHEDRAAAVPRHAPVGGGCRDLGDRPRYPPRAPLRPAAGSAIDHTSRTAAVLGQSVPGFIIAIVLLYLFSVQWRILPPRGPDEGLASLSELVLPSLALGFGIIGPIARLTRSAMLEVVNTEYITMGAAQGPAGACRHRQARLPQRDDPRHDVPQPDVRRAPGRGRDRGVDLPLARYRSRRHLGRSTSGTSSCCKPWRPWDRRRSSSSTTWST